MTAKVSATRQPDADLRALDRLVGTWRISGDAKGTVTYRRMDGATLTIWGGQRGSESFYKGNLSADGNTSSGARTPPGGGYKATSTRV
ncbi:MAG: hypothetical protein ACRDWA_12510 [Acidimicrobiia bacterium]